MAEQYSPRLVDFVVKMVIDAGYAKAFHAADHAGRQAIMANEGLNQAEQDAVLSAQANDLEFFLNIQVLA
ncbi:MAG: hypothetical protein Q8O42_13670 [Acidobacteriota bacterium]|nr:hypothetical protein [Acidobacteriota bacterium]